MVTGVKMDGFMERRRMERRVSSRKHLSNCWGMVRDRSVSLKSTSAFKTSNSVFWDEVAVLTSIACSIMDGWPL